MSGVDPADVIGVGIDFTACTMLPTTADGTPLCVLPDLRAEPHAWVKLWKHHAAQPPGRSDQRRRAGDGSAAGSIATAARSARSGSSPSPSRSSRRRRRVYARAERLIEAADWVVWQLTGVERRNVCTAGYKAMWSKADGFPPKRLLRRPPPGPRRRGRHPDDDATCTSSASAPAACPSAAAAWTGLRPGTAVAVANVDAHVAVPAASVTEAGRMVMIMGTSTCHMVLSPEERAVPGMCGSVEDGILPGFFGYEAGQSAVGDHFGWFVEHADARGVLRRRRAERGIDIHALLQEKAGGPRRRRVRPARARLVERQPLGPRRRRGQRPAHRRDAARPCPRRSTAPSSRRPPSARGSSSRPSRPTACRSTTSWRAAASPRSRR